VTYDIIPLLTLISSAVNLAIDIVTVLYNMAIPNYIPSNDRDDFVDSVYIYSKW
jgi:hypothetical protein